MTSEELKKQKDSKESSGNEPPFVVKSHDVKADSEYVKWLGELKERYHKSQVKAAIKVNSDQLLFNWQLGRDLVELKAEERWGKGVVEQVSLDLQASFPDVKGFSVRNLWNMKKWYSFYAAQAEKVLDASDWALQGISSEKLHQLGAEIEERSKLHQTGAEMPFPSFFGFVPWRHHVEIITKCKTVEEALFYIRKTVEEGYSRSALVSIIESDLYRKNGAALTNFKELLPFPQMQLAQEMVKSNYDLGFITVPANYDEKKLEDALEQNITRFLLELGTGFAFIGRQKEVVVAGKTRKIDLLFYHIRLRCYFVVELKVKPFEPEYAGKLNFYVSAVDELLKMPDDNPTIGLLICSEMNRTEVQWAFRNIHTPMGVATYSNVQIEELKDFLPSTEQICELVKRTNEEFETMKKETSK